MRRARRISCGVNFRGIHQHDRDVILNRVNAAALATFQTVPGRTERNRLFADWANQYVEQILSDHGSYIVARRQMTQSATTDHQGHERQFVSSTFRYRFDMPLPREPSEHGSVIRDSCHDPPSHQSLDALICKGCVCCAFFVRHTSTRRDRRRCC